MVALLAMLHHLLYSPRVDLNFKAIRKFCEPLASAVDSGAHVAIPKGIGVQGEQNEVGLEAVKPVQNLLPAQVLTPRHGNTRKRLKLRQDRAFDFALDDSQLRLDCRRWPP